jgi:Trypsin
LRACTGRFWIVLCILAPTFSAARAIQPGELDPITIEQAVDLSFDGPDTEQIYLDSGWVTATGPGPAPIIVFSDEIQVSESMWVRLHFGIATLSGERGDANASYLVLTSVLDGAIQMLWAEDLEAWSLSSAYFNGDTIRVELFASPDSGPSRVLVNEIEWGVPGWLDRSICGPDDNRIPSGDPAIARLLPSQCTAWLANDLPGGLLTAGHCSVGARSVAEFNVPSSTIGGSMVHPDPVDQYPVDPVSVQRQNGSGAVGNDWLFFGVFDNASTRQSPLARQGVTLHLAGTTPPNDGRTVSVTGYGQVSQPMLLQYNFIQLSDIGPFHGGGTTVARYTVDTTGGDSGAPVVDQLTGLAIAIHTNGGCNGDGWNRGTATTHPDLRAALAAPVGAATPNDGVQISFIQGRPATVSPGGDTILRVRVRSSDTRTPVADTAVLHVFDGTVWTEIPMVPMSDEVYLARFPAMDSCTQSVQYFVSVENTVGETDTAPRGAPETAFQASVDISSELLIGFNFEQSPSWTFSNDKGLSAGSWTIAQPPAIGRLGPKKDFDQSGRCLLTGSGPREDVDGGITRATSPQIRTHPGSDVYLSLALWHAATTPDDNGLVVEVSTDVGLSWFEIDRVFSTDGWEMRVYRILDFVTPTDQLQIRFVASDREIPGTAPEGGIVESAVDRIMVFEPMCPACPADLSGDGVLDDDDAESFLTAFAQSQAIADRTGDGLIDALDLISFFEDFSSGCP